MFFFGSFYRVYFLFWRFGLEKRFLEGCVRINCGKSFGLFGELVKCRFWIIFLFYRVRVFEGEVWEFVLLESILGYRGVC